MVMSIEIFAAASAGLFAGTALTAAIASKLYGWQRAEMDEPDAVAWKRGFDAGVRAGCGQVEVRPGAVNYVAPDRLLEPGEAPVHYHWSGKPIT